MKTYRINLWLQDSLQRHFGRVFIEQAVSASEAEMQAFDKASEDGVVTKIIDVAEVPAWADC